MSTIVTHVQATASSGDRDERIGLDDEPGIKVAIRDDAGNVPSTRSNATRSSASC